MKSIKSIIISFIILGLIICNSAFASSNHKLGPDILSLILKSEKFNVQSATFNDLFYLKKNFNNDKNFNWPNALVIKNSNAKIVIVLPFDLNYSEVLIGINELTYRGIFTEKGYYIFDQNDEIVTYALGDNLPAIEAALAKIQAILEEILCIVNALRTFVSQLQGCL